MIALTLSGRTLGENLECIRRNRENIDIAELRLDLLDESEWGEAKSFPEKAGIPMILTCRRKVDGGAFILSERRRKALLLSALDGSFSYVDLEEDLRKCELDEKAKARGIKVIRSFHDFEGIPSDIYSRLKAMRRRGDVVKAAVTPKSTEDVLTLFRAKDEVGSFPMILLGMGQYGACTRILYKRIGSMLSFASEDAVAPGQFTPEEMKKLYRADKVDSKTAIYGIIGNPIGHTSSPMIHNPGFERINYNAVYVPFLTDDLKAFFRLAEYLEIRGFSVTVPFKVDVLFHVGTINRDVKIIGSCNTVVREPGIWKGYNTDHTGFLRPLGGEMPNIKNAIVLGAGGAANAIVFALRSRGVKVVILNRTVEKAKKLAELNMCSCDSLDNAKDYEGFADLVVNTTSVGLGDVNASPIPGFKFTGREIVYDIVYKPRMTRMLKDAKEKGCRLHFGSEMLFSQGKEQFKLFTGFDYPSALNPEI